MLDTASAQTHIPLKPQPLDAMKTSQTAKLLILLRPTALVSAWLVAAPLALAQPLGEAPPGLVPADRLQRMEAKLATVRKDLEAAQRQIRELQGQLQKAPAQPNPDDAAARQQKADAELNQAHQRIAGLETQLKTLQAQRDKALAEANGTSRPSSVSDGKANAALRRERDELRGQLAKQQEAQVSLQAELKVKGTQPSSEGTPRGLSQDALDRIDTARIVDVNEIKTEVAYLERAGHEVIVPGCGANCPSFIVLPKESIVNMGSGSQERTILFKHRMAMGKTEVTVAQWRHFINDSKHKMPNDWEKDAVSDSHPVRYVSAQDADAYAAWFHRKYASQLSGSTRIQLQVVLPGYLEWEYAARAGRWSQPYQWDDGSNAGRENCGFANTISCHRDAVFGELDPVAKSGRQPNAWGLYDTIGNVEEWTSTTVQGNDRIRVNRGGTFLSAISPDLSSYSSDGDDQRSSFTGFRLLAKYTTDASVSGSPWSDGRECATCKFIPK